MRLTLTFLLLFTAINTYAQINASADADHNLQFKGTLQAPNKSNTELAQCIYSSPIISMFIASEDMQPDTALFKGSNSFSHYVDDITTPAGEVSFQFEYLTKDSLVAYRFYHFQHHQSDSKFQSVGQLPLAWKDLTNPSFSQTQYEEIVADLRLNVAHAVRMILKYCIQ